jgi:hypothetical protein
MKYAIFYNYDVIEAPGKVLTRASRNLSVALVKRDWLTKLKATVSDAADAY